MSVPVIYLPEARTDVEKAYAAYEEQKRGLGERFLAQLQRRVELISDHPELYGIVHNEIRAAPIRRFPYVVYYRFEGGTVYVIAVVHGRRDSQVWKYRA